MEQWAELRREHVVRDVSIKELVRRTGLSRNHGQGGVALACAAGLSARVGGSKLDPFKDEIHRLLAGDAELTGQRIRELPLSREHLVG